MAEKPDKVVGVEVTEADAGLGHNQPKEVVWERWQKKRTFVRALEGTYGELQQGLMDQPRIYKSKDWQWKGGPALFNKPIINPQRTDIAQSIETHISVIAPGGTGQRHGHMNSALFYIISGKGYDIHDGKRIDYEAGDVIIVENGCVHQHFNASDEEGLVSLVMKAKLDARNTGTWRPVTSWNGRVLISWPAPATPMITDSPQPLWAHSRAARISCTLPTHSNE